MIIGIDPGKTGGVASIDRGGVIQQLTRMPLLQHGKRDLVDPAGLERFADASCIVIEQVHAMPKQGVSSTFNFGRHVGSVECWALAQRLPVHWVTPAVWKKYFGLSSDKRASLDRARLEFGPRPLWDVLANDGVAEAALIALWWLRTS